MGLFLGIPRKPRLQKTKLVSQPIAGRKNERNFIKYRAVQFVSMKDMLSQCYANITFKKRFS